MTGRGNVKVSIKSAFDDRGVKQAEASLRHLTSTSSHSFRNLSALAGGGGIAAAFTAAAKAGIDFNSTMEQNSVALKQFLGSTKEANKFLGQLFETAKKTPFEFADITAAARKFLAFGFTAKQTKEALDAVGNSVAALGGGAEMIDRVTIALGQMEAKGRVQGDELLQLAEAGIPAYQILREKLHLTADEMKNIGKLNIPAAKGIAALVQGMQERFGNASKVQSRTFAGQMSTLKDNLRQTLGAMTEGLFAAMKSWLPRVNKTATDIAAIWKRRDLQPGDKIRLTVQEVRRNIVKPLEDAASRAHIGDKLSKAFEAAIPKVADAAAHVGVKAAFAFVKGFFSAGPLTQLLVGSWIAKRIAGWGGQFGKAGARGGTLLASRMGLAVAAGIEAWDLSNWLETKIHGSLADAVNNITSGGGWDLSELAAKALGKDSHPAKPRRLTQDLAGSILNLAGGNHGDPGPVVVPRSAFSHSGGGGTGAGFTKNLKFTGGGGGGAGRGSSFNIVGNGGRIIQGPYGSGTHHAGQNWQSSNAIDISVPVGTPVYAAGGGIITRAGLLPGAPGGRFAGQRVQIGNQFWYGHLSSLSVKEGDRVSAGDLIGYSGSANGSPHLHFATRTGKPRERYKGTQSGDVIVWRVCTLTWYDPALGGTNSGDGRADPNALTASGEAYNPKAYTCAAPPGFAFGTLITFAYGDRFVTCKVNDRGGAIKGHHFDLSRAAAAGLGMMGAGAVTAKYARLGKSRSIRKAKTPFDKLQNRLGFIDLEVGAGVLTDAEGAQQAIQAINRALPNLTGSNRLRAKGDRRTAQQVLKDQRQANRDRTQAGWQKAAQNFQISQQARTVNPTLDNPWLQAFLAHQDYLVASGQITQADGNANKLKVLTGALPGLASEADKTTALGMIADLRSTTIPGYDKAQADLALAGLTKTTGDDLAALNTLKGIDTSQLNDAVAKNDYAGIQQWASELKGVQDSIDNLDGTINDNNALLQQQLDTEKERSAQLERALAVAQSEERVLGRSLANQLGITFGIRAGMNKLLPTVGATP